MSVRHCSPELVSGWCHFFGHIARDYVIGVAIRFSHRVLASDLFGGESAGDVSERVRVRTGAAVLPSFERSDRVYVTGLELEVEQLKVLLHTRWRHRLREHDVAALDVPPQDDLRRCLRS